MNYLLDLTGLQIYDKKIKKEIKNNAYFVGTKEEYDIASANGLIGEGMLVILTDDDTE